MQQFARHSTSQPLRVGYVPLVDAAPLFVAREFGLFTKFGLDVDLRQQVGWVSTRENMLNGELDAAHALAPMVFALTLGLGCAPCECLTALVLNRQGNAITLSARLWERGVRTAADLARVIEEGRRHKTYTFGVVYPYSSHNGLLRRWLRGGGIDPDKDVRIAVLPPQQMFAHLMESDDLDGYCVGEPWNSVAILARQGFSPATSAHLAPSHTEKVLLVRGDFAEARPKEHLALVAALLEACEWCDAPENRGDLIALLARRRCLNVPAKVLRNCLGGQFNFGNGRIEPTEDFITFHRHNTNEPTLAAAMSAMELTFDSPMAPVGLAARLFRTDLFNQAKQLTGDHHEQPQTLVCN